MPTDKPLVSAVIPTRNRAHLLERALKSVIAQTYSPIEIIVVDDGSTDETPEVVQKYNEQHKVPSSGGDLGVGKKMAIIYIKNEQSTGAPAARNKGIRAAKGKFIAGLDDDDQWHEERICKLVAAYSDEYSCITSNTKMIYPNGQAVWRKKNVIDLNTLFYSNQVGNQVLALRDRLLEVGGFDESLKAAQDYDLWLRLCAKYGPVKNVPEPLQTIYMNHESERITDSSSFRGYLQFYQKHKHRMNQAQRRYQLYQIRRAQGKTERISEFFKWVPNWRYFKELKRILAGRLWK